MEGRKKERKTISFLLSMCKIPTEQKSSEIWVSVELRKLSSPVLLSETAVGQNSE